MMDLTLKTKGIEIVEYDLEIFYSLIIIVLLHIRIYAYNRGIGLL